VSPASGRLRWIPRSRAPCPTHSTTSPSSAAPSCRSERVDEPIVIWQPALVLGRPAVSTARTWRYWGAVFTVVAATGLIPTLTSCSPEDAGEVGLTVDSEGRLIGVAQVCRGKVQLAGVTRLNAEDQSRPRIGRWQTSEPVDGYLRLRFDDPPDGWTPTVEYEAPSGDSEYVFFVSNDSGDSQTGLHFFVQDLVDLSPGEVLSSGRDGLKRSTEGEFRQQACAR
jgi:hypothetical protein